MTQIKKQRKVDEGINCPVWAQSVRLISTLEQLPYGASFLREKEIARALMSAGSKIMAVGAAIFAIGWWDKISWLVETAFVITLVGWMMLIIGFAFWIVARLAKYMPLQRPKG